MSGEEFNQDILHKMLQSKIFQYLSMGELESLFSTGKKINFKAGETIVQEGQEGDEFYWIFKGRINIEINSKNEQKFVNVATLKEGDLLGEMVLLGKNRRTASAKAHTDCEVVSWKCVDCLTLFEKDTHVGFRLMSNFAQILADRFQDMNMQVRNNSESMPPDVLKLLRSA